VARYTYACLDCTHEQDVEHLMAEEPEIACENCGALMIRRPPKNVTVGYSPWDVLYNKKDAQFQEYRKKKARQKKQKEQEAAAARAQKKAKIANGKLIREKTNIVR